MRTSFHVPVHHFVRWVALALATAALIFAEAAAALGELLS